MSRDLGEKHTCFQCETKFYDLKKPVPLCPKCGADQRNKPPVTRAAERRKAAADLHDEDDEDDDDLDEDEDDEEH